jgi:5-methylcytosine-specific restriction endonuclease McrA
MLRRVENVSVSHRAGLFTKKGSVTLLVGARAYVTYRRLHRDDYNKLIARSAQYPVLMGRVAERAYWLFGNRWHWDNENLPEDAVYALLVTRQQRTSAQIDRARSMVAMQQAPVPTVRGSIPADLKQLIWQRDGGRCRACNSNVELQFDHVIPVAYGGATSAANLQILCGPCNRRKGASVS